MRKASSHVPNEPRENAGDSFRPSKGNQHDERFDLDRGRKHCSGEEVYEHNREAYDSRRRHPEAFFIPNSEPSNRQRHVDTYLPTNSLRNNNHSNQPNAYQPVGDEDSDHFYARNLTPKSGHLHRYTQGRERNMIPHQNHHSARRASEQVRQPSRPHETTSSHSGDESKRVFPFHSTPSGNFKVNSNQIVFESRKVSVIVSNPSHTKVNLDDIVDNNLNLKSITIRESNTGAPTMKRHPNNEGQKEESREHLYYSNRDVRDSSPTSDLDEDDDEDPQYELNLIRKGFHKAGPVDWTEMRLPAKSNLSDLIRQRVDNYVKPDCIVHIGNEEFNCHAMVLQCYSRYFDNLDLVGSKKPIILPEKQVSPRSFAQIYDWMINSDQKIQTLDRDNILEIFMAAQFLYVTELEQQCWAFLDSEELFCEDTAFIMYIQAKSAANTDVMQIMLPRIMKFFLALVSSKDYVNLGIDEITMLLQSNYICVHGEIEIFMSAVRWLMHKWPERKKHIEEVMQCVRFGLLPPWQLVDIRRNPENPHFVEVTSNNEVQRMVDDGLAFAIIKYWYSSTIQDYGHWIDILGLSEPTGRNFVGEPINYITYKQFVQDLKIYRRNYVVDQKRSKGGKLNTGKNYQMPVLPPKTDPIPSMVNGFPLGMPNSHASAPSSALAQLLARKDFVEKVKTNTPPKNKNIDESLPIVVAQMKERDLPEATTSRVPEKTTITIASNLSKQVEETPRKRKTSLQNRTSAMVESVLRVTELGQMPSPHSIRNPSIVSGTVNAKPTRIRELETVFSRETSQERAEYHDNSPNKNDGQEMEFRRSDQQSKKQSNDQNVKYRSSHDEMKDAKQEQTDERYKREYFCSNGQIVYPQLQNKPVVLPKHEQKDYRDDNDLPTTSKQRDNNLSYQKSSIYKREPKRSELLYKKSAQKLAFEKFDSLSKEFENNGAPPELLLKSLSWLGNKSHTQDFVSIPDASKNNDGKSVSFYQPPADNALDLIPRNSSASKLEKYQPQPYHMSLSVLGPAKKNYLKDGSLFLQDRESVLVMGGMDPHTNYGVGKNFGKDIYRFVPEYNSWEVVGEIPEPRIHHAVAFLKGRVFLAGGADPREDDVRGKAKIGSTVWSYEPVTRSWFSESGMKLPRMNFGMVATQGKLFVIGGQDRLGKAMKSVERFDPVTGVWDEVAPLGFPRMGVAATMHKGLIWVAGGMTGIPATPLCNEVECYNTRHDQWTFTTPLRFPRCFSRLIVENDVMYIIGGAGRVQGKSQSTSSIQDIDQWNDDTKQWNPRAMLAVPRHGHSVAYLGSQILIIGGVTTAYMRALSSIECYCCERKSWVKGINVLPVTLSGQGSITLPPANLL